MAKRTIIMNAEITVILPGEDERVMNEAECRRIAEVIKSALNVDDVHVSGAKCFVTEED